MSAANTVFLRLEGPLQSWGVTSRFVVRDTADVPSKSGVLGLVCAAMGLRRKEANERLKDLAALKMGVRIDRPGTKFTDYHTAGAKIGMMSAAGVTKKTATTGEYETHVMRKEYLADAAFLVALQGEDTETVARIAKQLQEPTWPPFLGRKSCPPSVPVFDEKVAPPGWFGNLKQALESVPWRPRLDDFDKKPDPHWAVIECSSGAERSRLVQDVPMSFTHRVYGMRWVDDVTLERVEGDVPQFTEPPQRDGQPATSYRGWSKNNTPVGEVPRREQRLNRDRWLCVFCKQPARDVHHTTYERVGHEDIENDLRSLCQLCHDAVTLLEYAAGMGTVRIDPCALKNRDDILAQRISILKHRDRLRRKRVLRTDEEDE